VWNLEGVCVGPNLFDEDGYQTGVERAVHERVSQETGVQQLWVQDLAGTVEKWDENSPGVRMTKAVENDGGQA
jgi:hypothetical protein